LAVGLASYIGYILLLSATGKKLVAVGAIVLVAAVNVRGVRFGSWFVRWLTVLKLGLLGFVIFWGFAFQLGNWSNFTPFFAQRSNSSPILAAIAAGMIGAFFSFGGWWDLTKLGGELRNPGQTLPKALAYGVAIVAIVYILTSFVFLYLVPLGQVSSGETFAAQAGEVLFGRVGGLLFSLIVIIAVLGSLTAVIMSAPRVYFAMARDRLFFPAIASVHPRFETPARATVLQAALATLLVVLGTFNQIVSYFVFVVVIFIALTVAGLFIVRRKYPKPSEYLTPGYPVTPVIFLTLIVVLLILLGVNNPLQAFLGVGVVSLSLPVYYLVFRSGMRVSQPEVRTEEPN